MQTEADAFTPNFPFIYIYLSYYKQRLTSKQASNQANNRKNDMTWLLLIMMTMNTTDYDDEDDDDDDDANNGTLNHFRPVLLATKLYLPSLSTQP